MFRDKLFDFAMPGNWLRVACLGISIPVMISAVPDQNASGAFERADQIGPLHPMVSSDTLRMPGISPLVRSL